MKKLLKLSILSLSMVFIFGFSTNGVNASSNVNVSSGETLKEKELLEQLDQETIDMFNEIDKYIIQDENGKSVVDIDAAIKNNVDAKTLEVMNVFNEISTTEKTNFSPSVSNGGFTTLDFSLPIGNYGNYCGKGNKGGTAIDDLDRACKAHDACFLGLTNTSSKNKKCNFDFVYKLLPIVQVNPPVTYKGIYARAALKLFSQNM